MTFPDTDGCEKHNGNHTPQTSSESKCSSSATTNGESVSPSPQLPTENQIDVYDNIENLINGGFLDVEGGPAPTLAELVIGPTDFLPSSHSAVYEALGPQCLNDTHVSELPPVPSTSGGFGHGLTLPIENSTAITNTQPEINLVPQNDNKSAPEVFIIKSRPRIQRPSPIMLDAKTNLTIPPELWAKAVLVANHSITKLQAEVPYFNVLRVFKVLFTSAFAPEIKRGDTWGGRSGSEKLDQYKFLMLIKASIWIKEHVEKLSGKAFKLYDVKSFEIQRAEVSEDLFELAKNKVGIQKRSDANKRN